MVWAGQTPASLASPILAGAVAEEAVLWEGSGIWFLHYKDTGSRAVAPWFDPNLDEGGPPRRCQFSGASMSSSRYQDAAWCTVRNLVQP